MNDRNNQNHSSHDAIIAFLSIVGFVVTATAAVIIIYRKFRDTVEKLNLHSAFDDIDLGQELPTADTEEND